MYFDFRVVEVNIVLSLLCIDRVLEFLKLQQQQQQFSNLKKKFMKICVSYLLFDKTDELNH